MVSPTQAMCGCERVLCLLLHVRRAGACHKTNTLHKMTPHGRSRTGARLFISVPGPSEPGVRPLCRVGPLVTVADAGVRVGAHREPAQPRLVVAQPQERLRQPRRWPGIQHAGRAAVLRPGHNIASGALCRGGCGGVVVSGEMKTE